MTVPDLNFADCEGIVQFSPGWRCSSPRCAQHFSTCTVWLIDPFQKCFYRRPPLSLQSSVCIKIPLCSHDSHVKNWFSVCFGSRWCWPAQRWCKCTGWVCFDDALLQMVPVCRCLYKERVSVLICVTDRHLEAASMSDHVAFDYVCDLKVLILGGSYPSAASTHRGSGSFLCVLLLFFFLSFLFFFFFGGGGGGEFWRGWDLQLSYTFGPKRACLRRSANRGKLSPAAFDSRNLVL